MNVQFTSLRGTTLTGKVQDTRKLKGCRVYFVILFAKIFAIVDGYEIEEMPVGDNMQAFEQSILLQL